MALPPHRRIYIETVIDDDGKVDGEKLLEPLNKNMESVYSIVDKGIRFGEHIISQIKDLSFTTSSTYIESDTFSPISFIYDLGKRPEGVLLMKIIHSDGSSTTITNPVYINWTEVTNAIRIDFITGLDDSTSYNIKLLVI